MKTLMLWDQCGEGALTFLELKGDYRHLDDVYINQYVEKDKQEEYNKKCDELNSLMPTGTVFLKEPTKDWDFFIICGFIP